MNDSGGTECYFSRAVAVAAVAHDDVGQLRKYTGEPYIHHPLEVAHILREAGINDDAILSAAVLHDVLEDTKVSARDLELLFPRGVVRMVMELTEPVNEGNRAARKSIEAVRLSAISPEAQTIKYADLISNTRSIGRHDKGFAKVYLKEKWNLLRLMRGGDKLLRIKAMSVCASSANAVGVELDWGALLSLTN